MLSTTFAVSIAALAAVATAFCPAATSQQHLHVINTAKDVLTGNTVEGLGSTLPSPNLYPHQWSWDSSFISMGYSHFNTLRAIEETDALFRGQWRNGAVPHIVFNPAAVESYFPGPAFWKLENAKRDKRGPEDHIHTSGIIQPPVHSIASLAIYHNARARNSPADEKLALKHLQDIYPKLLAWHNYLYRERDPFNRGLVFIRHMWESGMDNSPAWDSILERMDLNAGDVPKYKRVDKGKVSNVNERPNTFFYDRAVHLIKVFYDNDYDEARIAKSSRFLVEDVLYNSILARANMALAKIATIVGEWKDVELHLKRADWTGRSISKHLYHKEDGIFYNYDLVAKEHIKKRISGGVAGVFGAKMSDEQFKSILKHLRSDGFLGKDLTSWTLPSVAMDDPAFTNTTYWRGPAWINVNYLVRDGLWRNAGNNEDARTISRFLRDRSIELLGKSDHYEYFNPKSGSPHGGHKFSWSAALGIDMVCKPEIVDEMVPPSAIVIMWNTLAAWVRAAIGVAAGLLVAAVVAGVATSGKSTASAAAQQSAAQADEVEGEGMDGKSKMGQGSSGARMPGGVGLRRRERVPTRRAR